MTEYTVFTKNLSKHFTPEEVEQVYENALRYYHAAQNIMGLRMPRPLRCSGATIEFTHLPEIANNPTLSERWYHGDFWDEDVCHELGKKLGALHRAQGGEGEEVFLYGDFVPHNVVVADEAMIFFDTEPPSYRTSFVEFYHNSRYVDIVSMLFFIIMCHYFKTPWRFFRNKRLYVHAYLRGYEAGSGIQLNHTRVLQYINREQKKWLRDRGVQHRVVKKYAKYAFLKLVFWCQIRLYKIL